MCKIHEEVHSPPGLPTCLPFRVEVTPISGRSLFATRDVTPGEVVVIDEAAIVAPDGPPVCLGCMGDIAGEKKHPCPRCGVPMCTASCHWTPMHVENECEIIAASKWRSEGTCTVMPSLACFSIGILRVVLAARRDRLGGLVSHADER